MREARLNQLLEMIRTRDEVTIHSMVERFGVSAVTIRKDLDDLEQRGEIIRTFGGALPAHKDLDMAFQVRTHLHNRDKQMIGKMAAQMINPGENVIIDAGSTALEVVRSLKGIGLLQVITPALNVALEAGAIPGVTVVMPGPGTLDEISISLEGPEVEESFNHFHADKYFMGLRSVDLEYGFMDTNMHRVRLKQSMMKAARETIALADSSKFGRTSIIQIAPLKAVAAVVTDEGIAPEILEYLTRKGIKIKIATRENI